MAEMTDKTKPKEGSGDNPADVAEEIEEKIEDAQEQIEEAVDPVVDEVEPQETRENPLEAGLQAVNDRLDELTELMKKGLTTQPQPQEVQDNDDASEEPEPGPKETKPQKKSAGRRDEKSRSGKLRIFRNTRK